jgi:hypothetical protein
MACNINKTNGSKLTTVDDGSINSIICDLVLVGKNYAGYGQYVNENSIKLLENFANSKQPSRPITGQLWYDTSNKKLKFYNGSEFKGIPSLGVGSDAAGLTKGDLWYDESRAQLFYWNGSNEELIGPQTVEQNATGIVFSKVTDTAGFDHNVLLHQIQPSTESLDVVTVAITSFDAFELSTPIIAGFSTIVQGTTFLNSDPTTGVSTSGTPIIWGSSANAIRLGGRVDSDYVLYANPTFAAPVVINSNSGVNIQNNDIRLFINDAGVVSVAQISSRLTKMSFSVSSTEGGTLYNIINLDATSGLRILPTTTGGQDTDIGSSTDPFGTVYSNTFVGNLTGNVTGNITGTPTFPNITKSGTSGSGDIGQVGNRFGTIYATTLNATTNQATYADLAENYLTDDEYEPGTVLKIGGQFEVTICNSYESETVVGVVSTAPAYLMNSELENSVAIALKGRVPCKVKGPVHKGDILVSSDTAGHAEVRRTTIVNPLAVIGRALQDFTGDLGIIEILV